MLKEEQLDVRDLIKAGSIYKEGANYTIYEAYPATGILYVTERSKQFISGHVRMRGKDGGQYPYQYLEMIDRLFGKDDKTIEVCSGKVNPYYGYTVDINPEMKPLLVDDAQSLIHVGDDVFTRWRCDPPYNEATAKEMYGTDVPSPRKLLYAAERVVKPGGLMFLLLGPQNLQWTPLGVTRIGLIFITIVPNNEIRALHIYYKHVTIPKNGKSIDEF